MKRLWIPSPLMRTWCMSVVSSCVIRSLKRPTRVSAQKPLVAWLFARLGWAEEETTTPSGPSNQFSACSFTARECQANICTLYKHTLKLPESQAWVKNTNVLMFEMLKCVDTHTLKCPQKGFKQCTLEKSLLK